MISILLRSLLVGTITACIIVLAYSVAVTIEASQTIGYVFGAVGAGILALLVLVGLIDVDRADDGLLTSVLSLLPRTLMHANSSQTRSFLASVGFSLFATAVYWIGPAGLGNVVVACGEADKVRSVAGGQPVDCSSSYAEVYWQAPFSRGEKPLLVCYDVALVDWPGEWTSDSAATCGQHPLKARFVQVGVSFPEEQTTSVTSTAARDRASYDRLSDGLQQEIPQVRQFEDTMLFATWNIRWLGRAKRLEISYAHIAHIVSYFDVVAFQELQSQDGLDKILLHLGPDWRAVYGLESPGAMGNRERLGFLYDSRKVLVDPVSSNMVLASSDLLHTDTGQPARPPFVAAFSVNGRAIVIANTHIVFGRPDARGDRIAELKVIAQNLGEHAQRSFGGVPALLVGDFNAETADGPVIAAVEDAGFFTDATLRSAPTSVFSDRVYDQIFIQEDEGNRLVFGQTGTFNPFEYVMRREDMPLYKSDLARDVELTDNAERNMNLYLRWRSGQLSDHRLKWAEFRFDW